MGIFDEDNLRIEHPNDFLLLTKASSGALNIFPATANRDQRRWPTDENRNWPVPIDLVREWPDI